MKKIIKLAVVDDQHLFRKGLISLIDEFEELNVVIEASNGKELLEKLKSKKPDVILLDVEMPLMDGIETTECIRQKYPDIKILILTLHNEEEIILHLIEKGAHGFLLKDNQIETVVDAIYAVIDNGFFFNDRVSKVMVKGLMKNNKIKPNFNQVPLSQREIEVIRLICKEHTNKEIADKLFISPRTVDGHREKILQKTKAKNVVGIVMYAVENGLLD
ncbi:MAG TPA: response regulator transcription factor [Bacteroidia bacterium]|nr:response regulator transcription factor [Bacteroidia bacterium]